jgi:hypothetical protein
MMTFSEKYRPPIRFGIISAMVFMVLPILALDMGQCLTVYICALAAYLALLPIILLRHRSTPTKFDLLAIKWAFVILFLFGILLFPLVWRFRGVQ